MALYLGSERSERKGLERSEIASAVLREERTVCGLIPPLVGI
jgi:hypothetical protein